MNLEKQMVSLGKEIYQQIMTFVHTNQENDDFFYENAILKLKDGRKIIVPFHGGFADIIIKNQQLDKEHQKIEAEKKDKLIEHFADLVVNKIIEKLNLAPTTLNLGEAIDEKREIDYSEFEKRLTKLN